MSLRPRQIAECLRLSEFCNYRAVTMAQYRRRQLAQCYSIFNFISHSYLLFASCFPPVQLEEGRWEHSDGKKCSNVDAFRHHRSRSGSNLHQMSVVTEKEIRDLLLLLLFGFLRQVFEWQMFVGGEFSGPDEWRNEWFIVTVCQRFVSLTATTILLRLRHSRKARINKVLHRTPTVSISKCFCVCVFVCLALGKWQSGEMWKMTFSK